MGNWQETMNKNLCSRGSRRHTFVRKWIIRMFIKEEPCGIINQT